MCVCCLGAHEQHVVKWRDHYASVEQAQVNNVLQHTVQHIASFSAIFWGRRTKLELDTRANLRDAPWDLVP